MWGRVLIVVGWSSVTFLGGMVGLWWLESSLVGVAQLKAPTERKRPIVGGSGIRHRPRNGLLRRQGGLLRVQRAQRNGFPRLEIPPFQSYFVQKELDALRVFFSQSKDAKERAILAGLHWMVRYLEEERHFRSVFSDYVLALHELTLFEKQRPWVEVVRGILRRSFARAWPAREKIFAKSVAGKWDFVSMIYLLYQHGIPHEPYLHFYHSYFPAGEETQGKSFERAFRERDYDRLGDFLIDACFLDLLLRKYPRVPFRLPHNRLATYVRRLDNLPLIHSFTSNPDGYHHQNYFVTHVILSMNHYSESPLLDTPLSRRMLAYLKREFATVRYRVGDIDLLAEFVYSLKCYGLEDALMVQEAQQFLLAQQRPWGAWGKAADWRGSAYDAIHPTLAVITALNYRRQRER